MSNEIQKDRSPKSPALRLEAALEVVKELHGKIGKSSVGPEIAYKALGFKGVNGSALTMVATLTQYGLIRRDQGNISISPLALQILWPTTEANKLEAIRSAALAPKVFSRIKQHYSECAASVLEGYLVQEKFTPERARIAATIYKDNSSFAKLDEMRYIAPGERETPLDIKLEAHQQETSLALKNIESVMSDAGGKPRVEELSVPIADGLTARVPFPMSDEDFELLIDTLQLWKKKLTKQADPS